MCYALYLHEVYLYVCVSCHTSGSVCVLSTSMWYIFICYALLRESPCLVFCVCAMPSCASLRVPLNTFAAARPRGEEVADGGREERRRFLTWD